MITEMAKKRKRRTLTPYGKWAHHQLLDKNMSLTDLARKTGISIENLSHSFYGERSDSKYRPLVEKVLGKAPEELQTAS